MSNCQTKPRDVEQSVTELGDHLELEILLVFCSSFKYVVTSVLMGIADKSCKANIFSLLVHFMFVVYVSECYVPEHMTVDTGAEMAEGQDPDKSKGSGNCCEGCPATVNGHIGDEDNATGSSEFVSSILGHPSTILIVTNVVDATFVSTEAKVTAVSLLYTCWLSG